MVVPPSVVPEQVVTAIQLSEPLLEKDSTAQFLQEASVVDVPGTKRGTEFKI